MYYANGEKYVGNWEDNKKTGNGNLWLISIGTQDYNNGDQYIGEWKDNKKEGKGINVL
jgi:hypothetical protein